MTRHQILRTSKTHTARPQHWYFGPDLQEEFSWRLRPKKSDNLYSKWWTSPTKNHRNIWVILVTFTPLQFLLSPYFCTPFGHQKCVTRKLHPYPKPSVGRVECEDGGRVYLSKHTTKGKHVASVMNRIQERLVWHHEYLVEIRSSNPLTLSLSRRNQNQITME